MVHLRSVLHGVFLSELMFLHTQQVLESRQMASRHLKSRSVTVHICRYVHETSSHTTAAATKFQYISTDTCEMVAPDRESKEVKYMLEATEAIEA